MSSAVGARPSRTRSSSAWSASATGGWSARRAHAHVSVTAVVSWPASSIVTTSSRSCASVIRSPVCASLACISAVRRSGASAFDARFAATISSTTSNSTFRARRNAASYLVGKIGGSRRSFAARSDSWAFSISHDAPTAAAFSASAGAEQRVAHDPQGEPRHLAGDGERRARCSRTIPKVRRLERRGGHARGHRGDALALERRLREPSLPEPEVALARQELRLPKRRLSMRYDGCSLS